MSTVNIFTVGVRGSGPCGLLPLCVCDESDDDLLHSKGKAPFLVDAFVDDLNKPYIKVDIPQEEHSTLIEQTGIQDVLFLGDHVYGTSSK